MRENIKVLLVEDELLLLQGLRKLVDWEELGFVVCVTASNYLDAVSAAYLHKPDLIVTDIMLGAGQPDGLELVQYLTGLLPELQSVLLTGYDRFEYAERAITYSIKAYLLKPVSALALTDCLNKVRATFEQRRDDMRRRERMHEQLRTAQPFLFDWFLTSGTEPVWKEFFGLTGRECLWHVLVLSFSSGFTERKRYETFMKLDYLRENHQPDTLAFFRKTHLIYVLRSEKRVPDGRADDLAQMLGRYCAFNSFQNYAIGIGRAYCDFESIGKSYEEALSACRHVTFFGQGSCISYADIALPAQTPPTGIFQAKERLQFAVRAGRAQEAAAVLRGALHTAAQAGAPIDSLCSLAMEALVILNEVALENALAPIAVTAWQQVSLCENLESLCVMLTQRYQEISIQLDQHRAGRNHAILERVKCMIDNDYAKNLTLEGVASLVFLSPPYLGSLFHEAYGISFKDYLTNTRMEVAKKLLRMGSSKVYEIAEQVGYVDSRYFSQVFRKYTGKTPLEYRAQEGNVQTAQ